LCCEAQHRKREEAMFVSRRNVLATAGSFALAAAIGA
jgi:hypothetical protein